jgi:hypothetical protein
LRFTDAGEPDEQICRFQIPVHDLVPVDVRDAPQQHLHVGFNLEKN